MSWTSTLGLLKIQDAKNRHLDTIAQLCPAISSQLKHVSTIGNKLVKQQYLLHVSPQYGELRPTSGWDLLASLGHPSKFQKGFASWDRYCSDVIHVGQPNFAQCLAVSWAGTLYIHFWGLLPPNRILPAAKFTLRPSLAFSYIGSVTAQHFSSGCQSNFVAWFKEWNCGTFTDGATYIWLGGHHVGPGPHSSLN